MKNECLGIADDPLDSRCQGTGTDLELLFNKGKKKFRNLKFEIFLSKFNSIRTYFEQCYVPILLISNYFYSISFHISP